MSDLYDRDFVLWSEQQADRLRRVARGERVNDVDWENVVEEIESLGRSETSAVRSLLARALEHMLKAVVWPDALSFRKWLYEAEAFLDDARDGWAPGMASHIAMDALYAKALKRVGDLDFEEGPPGPLPDTCPITLAELLGGNARDLAARFRAPA